MQVTSSVLKAPTPPLSPRPPQNVPASQDPVKPPLEDCKSLSPASSPTIDTLEQKLLALKKSKDSFSKGSEGLELLSGFKKSAKLNAQQNEQIHQLINDIIIPLFKKGFIQRSFLKEFEEFKKSISQGHLDPIIRNLFNPSEDDFIASIFCKILRQEATPIYDLNGIVTLLADHINKPFLADYIRFIESYLLEPSLYNHNNSRPLLYQFLHHFVERAAEYHKVCRINPYNPNWPTDELCLNLSLNAKHLACCLELYSDDRPQGPALDDEYKLLLQKALIYLIESNNTLWNLVQHGIYHIDSLVYTLITQLEFVHAFNPEAIQAKDEEFILISSNIDATHIKEGVKSKLKILALAFRFGIPPLKAEMKDEAVAKSIEDYLKTV
jgi:hypothetical protein